MNHTLHILFNAIGFQIGWWLSVIGVMRGLPLLGPLAMGLFLVWHAVAIRFDRAEFRLLLIIAVVGTLLDSMLAAGNVIRYRGGYGNWFWLAPLWITFMWIGFGATLNHSLAWLRQRPRLAFLLGAVFGPLSYWTGMRLEVLQFDARVSQVLVVLALMWGFSLLGLSRLSIRLKVRVP